MKCLTGIGVISCLLMACEKPAPINKYADAVLVKIADWQDHRYSDSLYIYFDHKQTTYRHDAVRAFSSVQDSAAADRLGNVLLQDKDTRVRIAAAHALGQTPSKKSVAALREALSREKDAQVLSAVIEACGKIFSKQDIDQIEISSSDPLLHEGMAWACYRLGLRGLADSTHTLEAVQFLNPGETHLTRLGAANFFGRGAVSLDKIEDQLIQSAQQDSSPWVRAAVTSSLRKIKTPTSREALQNILANDQDYRVRISAVRTLQAFPLTETRTSLFNALHDTQVNVAIAAAETIRPIITPELVAELLSDIKNNPHWRVRALVYEAALAASADKKLTDEIKTAYLTEQNPYAKAALLKALSQSADEWLFVNEQLHAATIPVLKSSAAEALVAINKNKAFDKKHTVAYAKLYQQAMQLADAAVIGTVAAALTDSTLGYKKVITDFSFLYEAKKKLALPKDNEALQPIEAAIAYFEGKAVAALVKNEFNHPIDWALVKTIPADQRVKIETSKGDIVIRLLVEEAPGSVANFVQLVQQHYFDTKNFHRVVPNFVIQGGCNRGDGWGSEAYSIRSEFSGRNYTEGSVGMASAGKDTEGTQWFITHSPTPHLDGRYTVFAVTESGMDVVHQMEVGDIIKRVTLIE